MISKYSINNYKSIDSQDIELASLNLFSGHNSAGKTSAIHALLTASDNLRADEQEHLVVSKHLPPMTFNEVRNYIKNAKAYNFAIESENKVVTLSYTPADDAMIKTSVKQKGKPSNELLEQLSRNLFYLPAMRIAKLDETTINTNVENNEIGLNAEYVVDYFQNHRSDILDFELLYTDTKTLESQVNYWLNKLTSYTVNVSFDGSKYAVRFVGKGGKEILPCHVGTGVSYIVQVIMVCLAAKKNCLLVIENPEIHLHPSVQATMIDFLAMVSNTGRQIIIESHSDHIFNGIRRLLHNGTISINNVRVINFEQNDLGITKGTTIGLSQNGGVVKYTPGLFDQFDEDLDSILN